MLPFQQNIRNLWLRLYDHIYTQKYRYLYIIHNKYRILYIYIYIYTVHIYSISIHVHSDFFWWYVVQSVHLPFHSAIEALKLRTRCATLPVSRFSFGRVTVTIPHRTPNPKPSIWSTGFGKPGFYTHQSKCPSHTGEALCTHRLTTSTGARCWRWSCRKTDEQNGWIDLRKMV